MSYLVVDQKVEHVDKWVAAFSGATAQRRETGGELVVALEDPAEAGRLLVIVRFDSAEHARAWRTRPGIEEEFARVGVVAGSVNVRILEELLAPPRPTGAS